MPYNVDLPHFSGNEKEQLAQIRNYLYRQAEQLRYALNALDSSPSVVYNMPKSQAVGVNHADYVIEAGTSGGWTYRKWKKGTYEMHGSFDVTPTSSERGEVLYQTNAIEVPVPFPITEDAVVTGAVGDGLWLSGGGYASASAVSFKIMSDKEIGTTEGVKVRLCAVGTYAINTED